MLGKFIDKILEEKDELFEELREETETAKESRKREFIIVFLLFTLALLPRLYFIFFVSNPQNAAAGWYDDTYHHWQIAYLSREVGFSHGFLRLWDLKGLEYFWGLLHPLVSILVFNISGSIDIAILRILSAILGAGVVVLFYLLGKRYFNSSVGFGAAILAALNPLSVFNDTTGMLEFFGFLPLLLGIWFWPRLPVLTGLFWALSSMARAETWLFSLGLVFFLLFLSRERFERRMLLFFGYLVPILLYMKYLLNYTGNAIYPLYWNFLANAFGKWQFREELTAYQLEARYILGSLAFVSLIFLILTLIKKPKGLLFFLLGFGDALFITGFIGLTAYIKNYEPWFWMVRHFAYPYMFLSFLLALGLFSFIPRISPLFSKLKLGWIFTLLVLLASQITWLPILEKFGETEVTWQAKKKLASDFAQFYQADTVLIPEYEPDVTYALARFEGISGRRIQGQMYTPFAYEPFTVYDDPFVNWRKDREIIFEWLKKEDIRLIFIDEKREPFAELFRREPKTFKFLEKLPQSPYLVYEVDIR